MAKKNADPCKDAREARKGENLISALCDAVGAATEHGFSAEQIRENVEMSIKSVLEFGMGEEPRDTVRDRGYKRFSKKAVGAHVRFFLQVETEEGTRTRVIFEAQITDVDDWDEPGDQAWVKVVTGPGTGLESWCPLAVHLEDLVASDDYQGVLEKR